MTPAEFIRRARREGWSATPTRGGHLRLVYPDAAAPVFTSSTPGDHRAWHNTRAQMKRAMPKGDEDAGREADRLDEVRAIKDARPPKSPKPSSPVRVVRLALCPPETGSDVLASAEVELGGMSC